MTIEEERKICLEAEKIFKRGDIKAAHSYLEKIIKERESEGKIIDDFTAALYGMVLLQEDKNPEIVKHIVNQLSQTDNLKLYIKAVDMGAVLERNENGRVSAYHLVSKMKKEWLDRKNNYITPYYESKFEIMLAEYTTKDEEKETLLKKVIAKGYKDDVMYEKPNDVYVKASQNLLKTYLYNSKYDDALEICDKYLEKFTRDYHVLYYKAQALLGKGEISEAQNIINGLDTTKIRDKKISEKVIKLKSEIDNNVTTMQEVKDNYFGEISFRYSSGKILLPDEGKPVKKEKGIRGRRKKTIVTKEMVMEYVKSIVPKKIDVEAQMGSDRFNGYWAFSFSGEEAGGLKDYILLNKFTGSNASFLVAKDLELDFSSTTKGELVSKRGEKGGISKIFHSKNYNGIMKSLLSQTQKHGVEAIVDFNEKQDKRKPINNPETIARLNEINEKIKAAIAYKRELEAAKKAEKRRAAKRSWDALIKEEEQEIVSLRAEKNRIKYGSKEESPKKADGIGDE